MRGYVKARRSAANLPQASVRAPGARARLTGCARCSLRSRGPVFRPTAQAADATHRRPNGGEIGGAEQRLPEATKPGRGLPHTGVVAHAMRRVSRDDAKRRHRARARLHARWRRSNPRRRIARRGACAVAPASGVTGGQMPRRSPDPKNPPFNAGDGTLRRRQVRVEKLCKLTVEIGFSQPRGSRVGVVLVSSAPGHGEGGVPQGGTALGPGRPPCRISTRTAFGTPSSGSVRPSARPRRNSRRGARTWGMKRC